MSLALKSYFRLVVVLFTSLFLLLTSGCVDWSLVESMSWIARVGVAPASGEVGSEVTFTPLQEENAELFTPDLNQSPVHTNANGKNNLAYGITAVYFNGVIAPGLKMDPNNKFKFYVRVPDIAPGDAVISFEGPNWRGAVAHYTVLGALQTLPGPSISSLSPASGPEAGGNSLVLSGSGFQSDSKVFFGGALAQSRYVSSTAIVVLSVPPGTGLVDVLVQNSDGQDGVLEDGYTYSAPLLPPSISGLSSNSGSTAGGTALTISGTDFNDPAVSIGNTSAARVSWTPTSISIITPAGVAGAADVKVTNSDGQFDVESGAFTFMQPALNSTAITSLTPSIISTVGGTLVTIDGSFLNGQPVFLNGVQIPSTSINPSQTTFTAPSRPEGNYLVTVGPSSETLQYVSPVSFTVNPDPLVASTTPTSILLSGNVAGLSTLRLIEASGKITNITFQRIGSNQILFEAPPLSAQEITLEATGVVGPMFSKKVSVATPIVTGTGGPCPNGPRAAFCYTTN